MKKIITFTAAALMIGIPTLAQVLYPSKKKDTKLEEKEDEMEETLSTLNDNSSFEQQDSI